MEKSIKVVSYVIGLFAVIFLITQLTSMKFENLKSKNGLYNKDVVSIHTREKQLDCLAINIYREAGHEPFEGKVGVAQVTLNRAAHPDFPKDICAVVYQKNKVMERVVCQFSWYCDSAHKARAINRPAYHESMEVAKKVLLEGFRLPSLEPALYYHADYVNPQWRLDRITKIGAHIFYKPRDRNI